MNEGGSAFPSLGARPADTAAEARLHESEALFRTLAETTAAAIFIHRDATLYYVNPTAETLTGYRGDELLAMDFWDLVHPTMREAARAQGGARLRGEAMPVRHEVKIVTKQGEERWVEFTAAPLEYRGERAVLGTAFDITDRRHAEADRRAREQRFRALIEHSSDLVAVVGADGVLRYLGPSAERILGWRPEEWEGKSVFELVHDDDIQACNDALAAVLATPGASVTVQYRLAHKDGTWRWMEGIGTNLLHEPAIGGLIVNTRDITDRRRTEERLRASEERFALAADGAKDGIWDWNLTTDDFYMSPRMREILGIGDEAVAPLPLFEARTHPDEYGRIQEGWQAHLAGDTTHYEVEYRLRGPDGTYRWVLARARTVRDAGGNPQRMVGSLTDVTQRRRAEEDARQRQAELAHVLRVSAMGEMAAGIAHELNQPLAAIVNYARGCTRRLRQSDAPPEVLGALDRIAAEALRAGEVVHGLKRVVRKEPPHRSQVNVNDMVREAAQLIRAEAAERDIDIRLELDAALPPVTADHIQIEQVIFNLLRNAIEAIAQRGGLVAVRTTPLAGGVQVAIRDNGTGIPVELRERIFAPFFTTKSSGLGMGLSICHTIIEAHGGRLWAEPVTEGGTTFAFTLPRGAGTIGHTGSA